VEKTDMILLVVAGPSGTGKTTLQQNMVKYYPHSFQVLRQVTTRARREGEDDSVYDFIDERTYDLVHDLLICRTEVNGKRYGTMIPKEMKKIGIAVVNEQGVVDLRAAGDVFAAVVIVGLDHRDTDALASRVSRIGRDAAYLDAERRVVGMADVVVDVTDDYADVFHVVDAVVGHLSSLSSPVAADAMRSINAENLFFACPDCKCNGTCGR
jgi:guanylate kinase